MRIQHLQENNKGYFEHLLFTWKVALVLIVHGFLPMYFTDYASKRLCKKD